MKVLTYSIIVHLLAMPSLAQQVGGRSSLLNWSPVPVLGAWAGKRFDPYPLRPHLTSDSPVENSPHLTVRAISQREVPSEFSVGFLHLPNVRLKPALPFIVLGGGAYLVANPWARKRLVEQWEILFSPNHAAPENKGPFRFRTREEEASLPDQCDKWNHLAFSYLPLKPVATGCQYLLEGLPWWLGGVEPSDGKLSLRALIVSSFVVSAFGFLEEYVDGYEIDEGFSIEDMVGNVIGVSLALGKELGYVKGLGVYWTFWGTSEAWKYPWWNYMPGYEVRITYDFSPFIFGSSPESTYQNPLQLAGYLPPKTVVSYGLREPHKERDHWWAGEP